MTDATPLASEQITRAQIIAFLNGAGPLEGLHFGDPHPSGRAFWWRKHLPALSASPAPSGQGVSGEVPVHILARRADQIAKQSAGDDLPGCTRAAPAPSCAPGEVERLREALRSVSAECRRLWKGTSDWFDLIGIMTIADNAVSGVPATSEPAHLIPVTDDKGFVTLHQPDEDEPHKPGDIVFSAWGDDWPKYLAASSRHLDAATIERCAQVCEEQQRVFLSMEYASGQPASSFSERFAAGQCAAAIRAIAALSPQGLDAKEGCPVCSGDCGSANPPVIFCPMRDAKEGGE